MNFTSSNLKKIEELLKEANYELRYEKGNFQSGYCIIESRRVLVVNKYFTPEARFFKLIEIIPQLDFPLLEILSESSRKMLIKLQDYLANLNQLKLNLDDQ